MAEYPDVIVQVAWTTDPRTRPADPSGWTTVSADVDNPPRERLKVRRGLNMKANTIEAGTADIVLDNTNRELDPANTASTYYPNVKPRKRIRVRLDPPEGGEAVRDIFTGFVERWPVQWSMEDAWVKVEASDLIALIADEILPPSVLEYEVLLDSPTHFWPLTESFGQTAEDVAGVTDGRWYALAKGDADPIVPYTPEQSNTFSRFDETEGTEDQWVDFSSLNFDTTALTVGGWVNGPTSIIQATSDGFPQATTEAGLSLSVTETQITFRIADGTNYSERVADIPGGLGVGPHYVEGTYDQATDLPAVRLDGVELADTDVTGSLTQGGVSDTTIAVAARIGYNTTAGSVGHVSHVAFFDSVISTAASLRHYRAGAEAWSGDRTGERLGRILDALGIDANDRDIVTGVEVCGPTILAEQNAVEYLRKIAATEQSPLFVSGDGKITFPGQLSNAPTIAETFDDNDAVTAVRFVNVGLDYSLDRVINTASVKREGGNTQTAIDTDSQDDYGILNGGLGVVETLHRDPSGPRSLASSLVARNHEPKTIISSLDVDCRDEDSTVAACLDLEIGEAARVKATHPGGGSQISQDCYVESVEHSLSSPLQWQVSYGLSEFVTLPVLAWDTAGQGWDESVWSTP